LVSVFRRARLLIAAAGAIAAIAFLGSGTAVAIPFHINPAGNRALPFPPTTSYCLKNLGIHCYQPFQFDKAYALTPLHQRGINGRGETIVIVDSFGSPTIKNDLHVFDQTFGIVDPPSLEIRQDAGPVPPFDSSNSDMVGWAQETTLDVEWSHVFAPRAKIVLEETPVSETEGVTGFPQIVQAENYLIDHNIGDVISQSFGATEQTFPNKKALLALRPAFRNAYQHKVTVLGASGDAGATDYELNLQDLYPFPVTSWPSTDPLVTSVGGTMLDLDDNGNRLVPDVVWNDAYGAGGGGLSSIFTRPLFQKSVQSVVDGSRGTPDISMSAAVDGAVVYYYSFVPGSSVGYHLVGGTSEASPSSPGSSRWPTSSPATGWAA